MKMCSKIIAGREHFSGLGPASRWGSPAVIGRSASGRFGLRAFFGGDGKLRFVFSSAFGVTAGEKDLPVGSCFQDFFGNDLLQGPRNVINPNFMHGIFSPFGVLPTSR